MCHEGQVCHDFGDTCYSCVVRQNIIVRLLSVENEAHCDFVKLREMMIR